MSYPACQRHNKYRPAALRCARHSSDSPACQPHGQACRRQRVDRRQPRTASSCGKTIEQDPDPPPPHWLRRVWRWRQQLHAGNKPRATNTRSLTFMQLYTFSGLQRHPRIVGLWHSDNATDERNTPGRWAQPGNRDDLNAQIADFRCQSDNRTGVLSIG